MLLLAAVIGRILIAVLFVVSGAQKVAEPRSVTGLLAEADLPGWLAVPTGIFEILAGLTLASGFLLRTVSIILALFVTVTIFFFHSHFTDPVQGVMALKNMAIIGGLFLVFAHAHLREEHEVEGRRPWWRS